jgi:MFS family permease
LGSTLGVGLSAGLLLIASGSDWGDRYESEYYDDEEHLQATGLALLVVLGSAPVGAAIGSGLADDGLLGEAVFTGVLGELVVGGTTALAGAGVASLAGGTTREQNVAAGVGLSVGAAVGAALGAMLVGREHNEAFSYRDGAWRVGLPSPSVRPVLRDRPSVAVHVPLVQARF